MHNCLAASRRLSPLAHWGACSVRGRCPSWTCLSAQSCVVPVASVGESFMFGFAVFLASVAGFLAPRCLQSVLRRSSLNWMVALWLKARVVSSSTREGCEGHTP